MNAIFIICDTVQLWTQLKCSNSNHVRMSFTKVSHNHSPLPCHPTFRHSLNPLPQPALLLKTSLWRGHICSPRTAPGALPCLAARLWSRSQESVTKEGMGKRALDLESKVWALFLALPLPS